MAAFLNPDSDDEFGYAFTQEDEEALAQLASAARPPVFKRELSLTTSAIDSVPAKADDSAEHHGLHFHDPDHRGPRKLAGRISNRDARDSCSATGLAARPPTLPSPISVVEDVTYPDCRSPFVSRIDPRLTDWKRLVSRVLSEVGTESQETTPPTQVPAPKWNKSEDTVENVGPNGDRLSPLQKFRSYPRRPLAVSDLTSGAWCELQYEYTLTRLPGGRRTRTQAMRQGSKLHQKLEDEVHTTVKVDIMTKEDGFGLRLWNLVQGLRTLRDTGLTRELEVWGTVNGNLVNGVIDSVSYENPNPEFEQELSSQESQLGLQQSKVVDYFPPKRKEKGPKPLPKIYLTDVKTRGTLAPVSNALLRPAKIQLLLYHRFLSDMASGKLDYFQVCRRYGLDVEDPFSDLFIAQIGSLHDEIFVDASPSPEEPTNSGSEPTQSGTIASSDPESELSQEPDLVRYSNLRELISLVKEEVQLAFPEGPNSLGHMLRVQYIYRNDGRELDLHDFPVSKQALEMYLAKYMAWWQGEREAKGVDIEEAFKCYSCEFASDCSWRQSMDESLVQKARQKSWAKRDGKR